MGKKRKPRHSPPPKRKPTRLELAERAIEEIAARDHTTPDMVRKHIQVAMLNGLISDDPKVKAEWAKIPCAGEVPTPEELIAYFAAQLADHG